MSPKPRRLHSVPTGPDVSRPAEIGTTTTPATPLRAVDPDPPPTDTQALMDRIGRSGDADRTRTARQHLESAGRPGRRQQATLRVRADLDGSTPPIWRRLDLASDLTLDQVHTIVQSVFGWQDTHLHSFTTIDIRGNRGAERYLTAFDVANGEEGIAESAVQLAEVLVEAGDTLYYTYDFGDDWEHTLRLEAVLDRIPGDPAARCLGAGRVGPPEDSGGIWGYQDMLDGGYLPGVADQVDVNDINAALDDLAIATAGGRGRRTVTAATSADPGHQGLPAVPADLWARSSGPLGSAVQDMLGRIDFAAPIALPAATADRLAYRYSWLLDRVGSDGLDLTSAGYLKPLDVSAAFTELDLGSEWIGTGNREIHVRPLLMLRQSAQRLGLLRNSKGRLSLTKAGASIRDDPAAVVDWIASRLPLARRDEERDAGLALLMVVAANGTGADRSIDELVADVMSGLGWRGIDGRRVSGPMARAAADSTSLVLRQLGAVVRLPRTSERTITAQGAEFARLALTLGSPGPA